MDGLHLIVLPGGGYRRHAPHEGEPVAEWLRGLGFEASVFAYPVKTRHPGPLDAVRAEIRRVREAGAARVGVVGFSAGGHAAGMAAFAPGATPAERVDVAVLGYPVVSMMLEEHRGSREKLLGKDASWSERAATSLDLLVTASAPPTFVWHTADDAVVPVQHSYLLGMALAGSSVPHEAHVLPTGTHGLGLAEGEPAAVWTGLCAEWLGRL
ncbi:MULTISPECIES: prolyl oligopeptidase family serine peptidase [unclassified Salinibacterium]|uniref:alpha/beta hydrolase n=1 Tax=unclassified Salinibacterium TaxID=2632331 RepID=UPI001422F116|nr:MULTISPECIES: prolyl oligopeptidase family serine peptidase [unclassified Salinibacterium]